MFGLILALVHCNIMRARNMVLLCLFAFVRAVTHGDLIKDEWDAFKLRFNKQYDNEFEERNRMGIFAQNKHEIAEHNELFELGVESYAMAINEFADMTHEEFRSTMTMHGLNLTEIFSDDDEDAVTFISPANIRYPSYIDWRKKGAVTKVKNQLLCGACWAFSATGALEAQHYRKTRRLISLSEQNLIDCSAAYGNKGCSGGLPSNAFKYIKANKGVDTEKSYPYRANQGHCSYNPRHSGAKDKGFISIPKSEYKLKKAVATKGPVSVVVDSRHMRFYSHGVFYYKHCSNHLLSLDHAVLVVGYGHIKYGGDYWLIKNSWGATWGSKGYMKLARNRKNHCGVANLATVPLV